jgi:hypothetical protein
MCEGRVTGELDIAEATQEKIMTYATQRGGVMTDNGSALSYPEVEGA